MGYKADVIKGVSWFGLLRFSTKVVGFLEAIILARILLPEQFGAYGVALLALGILEVITETGVNIFLIQEKEIDKYINSAWVISIIRGLIIGLIIFLASPLIASFFHSQASLPLLQLVSLVPILRGFINPSVIKFQKELLFSKDFKYRATVLFIDTVVSIVICFITKSPVGIVIGLLAGVVVELGLSFIIIKPRPVFEFHKEYLSKLFHRGKWVTAAGIFDYLFANLDNIIVGRLLGTGALGIYQMAYALTVVPLSEVGKIFVHVTYPVMVKISGDSARLKGAYTRTVWVVFALILPITVLLVVFPQIVNLVLGAKWAQVSTILPLLAVLGLFRAVSGTSSAVFLSLKKQRFVATCTLVTILGMGLTIVPLVEAFSLKGAAIAALFGTLLSLPVIVYYLNKSFYEKVQY